MKVLHVITGLGVGGAELQLRALLQQTRHDADVVTLYNAWPGRRHDPRRWHRGAHARHAAQYPAVCPGPAPPDHPGRSLRRRAHAPVSLAGLRAARRLAGGHAGHRQHRALHRRDAPGAQADDVASPGALPGDRALFRHDDRGVGGGARPDDQVGGPPAQADRHPERSGPRQGRLRSGRPRAGARRTRHRRERLRAAAARAPGSEQALRPGHPGGRAEPVADGQGRRRRRRRGARAPGGNGPPLRRR